MTRPLASQALLATISLACSLACAQSNAPGRIEQDTRTVPEPARRDSIRVPRASFAEQAPPGAREASFTLGSVQVSGMSALPGSALDDIWAGRLGQRITLAEAFEFAARISARYREAGFILSQAVVPVQDLPTDTPAALKLQVLEGYVERVSISGFDAAALQPHLAALTQERPLRLQTLERTLLLVNELAGMRAEANLKAGSAPGSTELELVAQQQPRAFSLQVHNRSTPSQGRARLEASADLRGVLGAFDRHTLRLVSSGDQRLNLLSYAGEAPVGVSGTKANWSLSESRSKPDSPLPNVDTQSDNASIGISHPLLRSRVSSVGVRALLAGYDNRSGDGLTSRDRIRALHVGVTADYADASGVNLADLEFVKGLRGLGASQPDDPLLNGARPDFSKTTLYLARLQSLGGEWSALAALSAQASGDRLPTAEQLGLGGEVFLRAFDPSEVIGENGWAAKLELRWNRPLLGLGSTFYLFGDAGRVRRKQLDTPDLAQSLAAWGGGVRFSAAAGVRGYLEVAKPLKKDVASKGNRDARVFGGIGIDF